MPEIHEHGPPIDCFFYMIYPRPSKKIAEYWARQREAAALIRDSYDLALTKASRDDLNGPASSSDDIMIHFRPYPRTGV